MRSLPLLLGATLALPLAAQSGLRGEYFDSAVPPAPGTPASFERLDGAIDFSWSAGTPPGTPLLDDGSYSVRWTGWLRLPQAGDWSFFAEAKDGVRLWIDQRPVIDAWTAGDRREQSGRFTLDPAAVADGEGGWVPLRLEYFNQGGAAELHLSYESPFQRRQVIPVTSYCDDLSCVNGDLNLELDAEVFLEPHQSLELQPRLGTRVRQVPGQMFVRWAQRSGPPVTIVDPNRLSTTLIPGEPGIVRLTLHVQEGYTRFARAETTIYVLGDAQDAQLVGLGRKWHKLSLSFSHSDELFEDGSPNPFTDFRLQTTFFHPKSGRILTVPGFFAADGDAAETGATSGKIWMTNFVPDQAGTWYYLASFRTGPDVSIDLDPAAGTPISFDGANGKFAVLPADPDASGFLAKGRLEYVGGHHLRFAETHEYFLKSGADSPENFLGYYEFDGTSDQGGSINDLNTGGYQDGLHHFDAHLGDYVDRGVPLWQGDKGRRIFGAIDYLASQGVNSLYALSYNVDGGDGREVWPWITTFQKRRFDVSKLAQWERVVDHMTAAGVAWHVVTQETENDRVLDLGELGPLRKLYYRELIARFGHALGLFWNLGEENNNTLDQRRAFADYIHAVDPWDHPIALHNHAGSAPSEFGPLLGTHLELVSFQGTPAEANATTQDLVRDSASAGRPWVVNYDEQNPANDGVVPDADDFWHDSIRKSALWPNLMAHGGGCEWYFGYAHPNSDLDCEDFRSRENMWQLTSRAIELFQSELPFAQMESADLLGTGAGVRVLAARGWVYALYLPEGGPASIDLESNPEVYRVRWFDARNGGSLQQGSVTSISGPGVQSIGTPPGAGDWLALVVRNRNLAPEIESVRAEPDPFPGNQEFSVVIHVSDANDAPGLVNVVMRAFDPQGNFQGTYRAFHRGGTLYSIHLPFLPSLPSGNWTLVVTARDPRNRTDTFTTTMLVE